MPNDAARLVRETVATGAKSVKLVGAHDLLYACIGHYAVAYKEKERLLVEEAQETLRVRELRPDLLPIVLPVAPELLRRPDSCVLEASVLAFVVVLLQIRRNGELYGREERRYQVALVR